MWFKLFVQAGVFGIVYVFLLYIGTKAIDKISFVNLENMFGLGRQIVLDLYKTI